MPVSERLLADTLVAVHLGFIVFVVLGGLLALRNRFWLFAHLPAAAWGAWIEFSGRICPLTPIEQQLRIAAGEAGYTGGFIEHYLIPLIYPVDLDRTLQLVLGATVVLVNIAVYVAVFRDRLFSHNRRE